MVPPGMSGADESTPLQYPCDFQLMSFALAKLRGASERMAEEDAETNAWREHVVSSPLSCRDEYAIHHTSLVYL